MKTEDLDPSSLTAPQNSALSHWIQRYNEDPWDTSPLIPDHLLAHFPEYFPEAARFRIGRSLISELTEAKECIYRGEIFTIQDDLILKKLSFFLKSLPKEEAQKIKDSFLEYYRARGRAFLHNDNGKKNYVTYALPIEREQGYFSCNVGVEIEVDNSEDPDWEIRTFPMMYRGSLALFFKSIVDILRLLEDKGCLPSSYEMNMHVNFGGKTKRAFELLYDNIEAPLAELGRIHIIISSLFLPSVTRARLERILWLSGAYSPVFFYNFFVKHSKYQFVVERGDLFRVHVPFADVSAYFDIQYFVFACDIVCGFISLADSGASLDSIAKKTGKVFKALSCVYEEHFGLVLSPFGIKQLCWNLADMPWLEYHEKLYFLRREIMKELE